MVLYGSFTSVLLIMCFVVVFCPDVSDIVPGDLVIGVMQALPDGVHSQVMRFQKHFVIASLSPVELSFFLKSCAIFVAFLIR